MLSEIIPVLLGQASQRQLGTRAAYECLWPPAGDHWAAGVSMWQSLLALVLAGIPSLAIAGALTQVDQSTARQIYIAQCSRCHRLHDPSNYASEEWRLWTKKMCKKTRLSPAEQSALVLYLQVLRAEPGDGLDPSSPRKLSVTRRAQALTSPKDSN